MRKGLWIVIIVSIAIIITYVFIITNVFVQLGPKKAGGDSASQKYTPKDGVDFKGYLVVYGEGNIKEFTDGKTTPEIALYQTNIAQKREFLRVELDKISPLIKIKRIADNVISADVIYDLPPNKLGQLKNAVAAQNIKLSPNWALQPLMQQSIPIVNAEDVWNLNAAGGVCTPVPLSAASEFNDPVEISSQCQKALIPLNNIINEEALPTARNIIDLESKCTDAEIGEFTKDVSGGAESIDPCSESEASDINNDGVVNILDMISLLRCYGEPAQPNCVAEDINNDGVVNVLDFIQLSLNYGQVLECECMTGKGVIIAVIDTGADYTHLDLGNCTTSEFLNGSCEKVIGGWDFEWNDSNPFPESYGGIPWHGTHVASIAAGKGDYNNNDIYEPDLGEVWGVAPDAKILAYKIEALQDSGIAAYERAVDPDQNCPVDAPIDSSCFDDHADIITLSWGAVCALIPPLGEYDEFCGPDDPLSTTVDNAFNIGSVITVSAGNSGNLGPGSIGCPACARNAITVGATDDNDLIASFSSRGPIEWFDINGTFQHLDKPDIAAPGVTICAARANIPFGTSLCIDGKHQFATGTSMAAPHVAGAAALLLQKNPDLTPSQIKQILMGSAVNLSYHIWSQGAGRLDVLAAFLNSSVSNESHGVCLDSSCMIVPGSGIDECVIDADCPTCGDGICEGNEDFNNCPADNCPSHLECVSQACVPVAGAGGDLCSEDTNCTIDSLLVFVSTATTNGAIGSLANADTICNEDPQAQSGTYKAWLSTSTPLVNAKDRIVDGVYVNIFGDVIANNINDLLDGSLNNSIHPGLSPNAIWTGTLSDGTAHTVNCNNWQSFGTNGRFGFATSTFSSWTSGNQQACSIFQKLYCFQVS